MTCIENAFNICALVVIFHIICPPLYYFALLTGMGPEGVFVLGVFYGLYGLDGKFSGVEPKQYHIFEADI